MVQLKSNVDFYFLAFFMQWISNIFWKCWSLIDRQKLPGKNPLTNYFPQIRVSKFVAKNIFNNVKLNSTMNVTMNLTMNLTNKDKGLEQNYYFFIWPFTSLNLSCLDKRPKKIGLFGHKVIKAHYSWHFKAKILEYRK